VNSMTGFGRASKRDRRFDIDVEARSVNHRFLSLKVSLPEGLSRYEGDVDQAIRRRLARGSVTLSVSLQSAQDELPSLPAPARVKQVYQSLDAMRRSLGLKGEIPFDTVLSVPGLFNSGNHVNERNEKAWPIAKKLIDQALDALIAMREREGETIRRDLLARLDAIEKHVKRIRERAPLVLTMYHKKLEERIGALLTEKGMELSKQDLVKEVAVFADRCDISEEVQRLGAHVEGMRRIFREGGQIGRRLDFLTQEMVRETNTLASKGSDAEISSAAVEIKAEVEKIKEQAENVE